jgi:hypothetical protein
VNLTSHSYSPGNLHLHDTRRMGNRLIQAGVREPPPARELHVNAFGYPDHPMLVPAGCSISKAGTLVMRIRRKLTVTAGVAGRGCSLRRPVHSRMSVPSTTVMVISASTSRISPTEHVCMGLAQSQGLWSNFAALVHCDVTLPVVVPNHASAASECVLAGRMRHSVRSSFEYAVGQRPPISQQAPHRACMTAPVDLQHGELW